MRSRGLTGRSSVPVEVCMLSANFQWILKTLLVRNSFEPRHHQPVETFKTLDV